MSKAKTLPGMIQTEPPGWGDDTLSQFMSAGWRNAVHSFTEDPEHFQPLAEIDGVYRRLIENLADNPEQLAGTLLIRAHSAYLAAASLAVAGQVAEAYRLMRGSLQAALLGLFVAENPERQKLWAGRNDDAARARTRIDFNHERLVEHLRTVDAATAKISAKLRERTLEHESHPNTYAAISKRKEAGDSRFDFTREYFVTGDEVQGYCLRTVAQVGICALSILFYVFPESYRTLGLDDRLTKLRQGH